MDPPSGPSCSWTCLPINLRSHVKSWVKLKRPTLLVTGERSPAVLLMITAELEGCLEGESQVMVPNAGHGMHDQSHLLQPGCNGLPAATLARARACPRPGRCLGRRPCTVSDDKTS